MPPALVQLLAEYGYVVLGLTVALMNAGIPVPGHAAYVAACVLAAQKTLSLPLVVATGVGAAILGASAGFAIGARGGRKLVESVGPKVGLTAPRLAALEGFFVKHGDAAIFFTRFIIVVRTFGSLFAGVSEFPARRFLVVSAAGAIAWGAVYAAVGTVFKESWTLIEDWLGRAGLVGLAVAAAAGFAHVLWLRSRKRRR